VPAGAVLTPTRFRVALVGGLYVACNFEPHGTTFAVPLILWQVLSKTNDRKGTPFRGGNFSGYLVSTA